MVTLILVRAMWCSGKPNSKAVELSTIAAGIGGFCDQRYRRLGTIPVIASSGSGGM